MNDLKQLIKGLLLCSVLLSTSLRSIIKDAAYYKAKIAKLEKTTASNPQDKGQGSEGVKARKVSETYQNSGVVHKPVAHASGPVTRFGFPPVTLVAPPVQRKLLNPQELQSMEPGVLLNHVGTLNKKDVSAIQLATEEFKARMIELQDDKHSYNLRNRNVLNEIALMNDMNDRIALAATLNDESTVLQKRSEELEKIRNYLIKRLDVAGIDNYISNSK